MERSSERANGDGPVFHREQAKVGLTALPPAFKRKPQWWAH
jgi:hypothetical protein